MHRSGQTLFLPHALSLKQKEKTSAGHLVFFIAATYMSKNQSGFIYLLMIGVDFKLKSTPFLFGFLYKKRQKNIFLAGVSLHYLVNKQRSIHIEEGRLQICCRSIQMNKQKKIITNY
ncbi:hypothetical protein AZF08_06515 [Bacillus gaemokensis]|nr:hypothetical protein AZF08_06515 [Bacillus gaemokensis]